MLLLRIFIPFIILTLFSNNSFGFTPKNYGKLWNNLTKSEQLIYVNGIICGYTHAIVREIFPILEQNINKKEIAAIFKSLEEQSSFFRRQNDIDFEVMRKSISDFYRDPANSYIEPTVLLRIAYDKLEGKSIEADLQNMREFPWRLKNSIKRKE